jgi:hypothetical protein
MALRVFGGFKTAVLLVAAMSWLAISASAQEEYEMYENRKFYGGLVLGGNFAQVDGDNFAGYHKVGLNVGATMFMKLDEHVAASVEILFSQKGSRAKEPQQLLAGTYIKSYGIDMNYAEVPVLINYFDKRKSHFGGGFSYSRLASVNEYITEVPPPNPPIAVTSYPFKKDDINLLLSGSLHLYKGLFFNVRFQYSVVSIRNKIPTNYARAAQYNNLWTMRLIYLF